MDWNYKKGKAWRQKSGFFLLEEGWYFRSPAGRTFGPFDKILEIPMDRCVNGTWQGDHKELTGAAMARLLECP